MSRFTILQASDLHIGHVPYTIGFLDLIRVLKDLRVSKWMKEMWQQRLHCQTTHNVDALEALADLVYENREDLDAILLTGDLAACARALDIYASWRFTLGPAVWGAFDPTVLGDAQCEPLLGLLPGNHDRFAVVPDARFHDPLSLPGSTLFDILYGSGKSGKWCSGQGAKVVWRGTKEDNAKLVIIGADLSLRSGDIFHHFPLGHYGHGRVYSEHVADPGSPAESLIAATRHATGEKSATSRSWTVIWMIHFDPTTDSGLLALLDKERLLDKAVDMQIPAILCGHTHRTFHEMPNGVHVFGCGTATCCFPEREGNVCQLLDVGVDPHKPNLPTIEVRKFWLDGAVFREGVS